MSDHTARPGPQPTLRVIDTVALVVGIVIGAGIFKTPPLIAANTASVGEAVALWVAGGVISLIGALCYAELASANPHPGGEYHFLTRAYGRTCGFLFAWARMTVIQTGSIALLAYVFGDYAAAILPLGPHGPSFLAALSVLVLTGINIIGIRHSARMQNILATATVVGLLCIIVAGFALTPAPAPSVETVPATGSAVGGIGLAMVFVLLTFGGWNEAAYVSAELRDVRRNMVRALLCSLGIITALYVTVNLAYFHALGRHGMAESETVASDLMRAALGDGGAVFVSLLVAIVALASINVTILTGARTNYALAQDFRLFAFLGRWNSVSGTPTQALLLQGGIALLLIGLAALTRRQFETVVEYISPVFWLFFLLTGISLFIERRRRPAAPRPFRVPLYPLTPALFCLSAAYLLYASISYTGFGALVGVAVLVAGVPMLLVAGPIRDQDAAQRPRAGS